MQNFKCLCLVFVKYEITTALSNGRLVFTSYRATFAENRTQKATEWVASKLKQLDHLRLCIKIKFHRKILLRKKFGNFSILLECIFQRSPPPHNYFSSIQWDQSYDLIKKVCKYSYAYLWQPRWIYEMIFFPNAESVQVRGRWQKLLRLGNWVTVRFIGEERWAE